MPIVVKEQMVLKISFNLVSFLKASSQRVYTIYIEKVRHKLFYFRCCCRVEEEPCSFSMPTVIYIGRGLKDGEGRDHENRSIINSAC